MNRFRYLSWPVYVVAAMLVLLPLAELFVSIWPLQPGVVRWRFGAVGLLSGALLVPILGIVLAYALAVLLEHRMMQRIIALLSGLVAVALVAAAAGFVLDALQMRVEVRPQAHRSFDMASVLGLGKMLLAMVALVSLGVAGWRSARVGAPERGARKKGVAAPVMARPAAEARVEAAAPPLV